MTTQGKKEMKKQPGKATVLLVTKNSHKVREIGMIMEEYGIKVKQHRADKSEHAEWSTEKTARVNAEFFSRKTGMPVIVDDSGIEFEAYPGFPGSNPRWLFERIGYDGIMRLLKGKSRRAAFKCSAGFCMPHSKPIVRNGFMRGKISEAPKYMDRNVMPYERIFIPDEADDVLAALSREKKNMISHRSRAFRKLARIIAKTLKVTA
ncbi:non-canonical purine NTP pyrophosphatase [Candidatus Woesearchaeota archaeon]|nr:MAG: non-canonical purine NTP pyrophosphatase [Candidatus Woesearchaeota archaeon]